IEHQVLANVQPGSIVLFHANGRGWHTDGALPGIIATLKARGYEFATVSELLAAGEPVVSATCYDSRPGDTDRPRHPLPVATNPFGFGWLWQGVASPGATSVRSRGRRPRCGRSLAPRYQGADCGHACRVSARVKKPRLSPRARRSSGGALSPAERGVRVHPYITGVINRPQQQPLRGHQIASPYCWDR